MEARLEARGLASALSGAAARDEVSEGVWEAGFGAARTWRFNEVQYVGTGIMLHISEMRMIRRR